MLVRFDAGVKRAAVAEVDRLMVGGLSQWAASHRVCGEVGCAASTVRGWLQDGRFGRLSVPSVQLERLRDFNQERRAEAGNRLALVIEGRIGQLEKALTDGTEIDSRQIRELAIAFGVMTDKRRLEDGLVTDRTEQTTVPAREIIEGKIDELAERRKRRDG